MRFVFLLTLVSFLFVSCSKNDGNPAPTPDPVIPLAVDTLTAGWQVKKIDSSGRTLADVFFTNATTGFACGYSKALFKTTDGGINWQPIATSVGNSFINIQFLDNQYGFMAADGGVMRTNDGGTNWQLATVGSRIDVFFINPAIGFCTSQNALMKSIDSGKTWISVQGNFSSLSSLWFVNATKGFVTSSTSGLIKTLDGGTTFTTAISVNSSNYKPVYFANTTNGCTGIGMDLFITNDGGNNWSLLKHFSAGIVDAKNTGPNEYYVATGADEIWHTTDSGNTWVREVKLAGGIDIAELTLTQPGRVWAASYNGRLYYK